MNVFLTFGGGKRNFVEAAKRLEIEAKDTQIFDTVICYFDKDLLKFKDFWEKHGQFINENPRLYGYAIWKPFLILHVLEKMNYGDKLFYADAGCQFDLDCENPKLLYEELLFCSKGQDVIATYSNSDRNMNKRDIIVQMNMTEHPLVNGPQIQTTTFILKKTERVMEFVRHWYGLCCDYHLIDDSPSITPNTSDYDEHRHEQSVFSLLLKKMDMYDPHNYEECNMEKVICLNRNRTGASYPACRVTGSMFYNFNNGDQYIGGTQIIHMSNLIRSINPEYIVETGFASARTCATMVQSCRVRPIQHYLVCDINYLDSSFQNYFAIMCPYIYFCTGSTQTIFTEAFLKEQFPTNKIDWVTIDGDQTYDGILHELTVLLPFVRKNGIIYVVGDQNTRPQLYQACNKFKELNRDKIVCYTDTIQNKRIEYYRPFFF